MKNEKESVKEDDEEKMKIKLMKMKLKRIYLMQSMQKKNRRKLGSKDNVDGEDKMILTQELLERMPSVNLPP